MQIYLYRIYFLKIIYFFIFYDYKLKNDDNC